MQDFEYRAKLEQISNICTTVDGMGTVGDASMVRLSIVYEVEVGGGGGADNGCG